MNQKTIEAIYQLKSVIQSDKRFLELKKAEEKLSSSSKLVVLKTELDNLIMQYEDAFDAFGEDSSEAKNLIKKIHEKKIELDTQEVAKEYTEKFIVVRDLYMQINAIIFSNFKEAKLAKRK